MKSRWLVNLVLLALVAAIGAFIFTRPKETSDQPKTVTISTVPSTKINLVRIEFPAKKSVVLTQTDGHWFITEPIKSRASELAVERVAAILSAPVTQTFPAIDLAKFGLDKPSLKVKLNDEEFIFGIFNPVTAEQYVQYKNAVYLLPSTHSEAASIQVNEFIDKNVLGPIDEIVGFDLAHLEQWEDVQLQLSKTNTQWAASVKDAKVNQAEVNEWFANSWTNLQALSVEPYNIDHKANYPYFELKLKNGKVIHFDKIQESPELQLYRSDEGLLYHLQQEIGFTILNPPVTIPKK